MYLLIENSGGRWGGPRRRPTVMKVAWVRVAVVGIRVINRWCPSQDLANVRRCCFAHTYRALDPAFPPYPGHRLPNPTPPDAARLGPSAHSLTSNLPRCFSVAIRDNRYAVDVFYSKIAGSRRY